MSICKHGNQSNSICRLCMMDQAPASSPRDPGQKVDADIEALAIEMRRLAWENRPSGDDWKDVGQETRDYWLAQATRLRYLRAQAAAPRDLEAAKALQNELSSLGRYADKGGNSVPKHIVQTHVGRALALVTDLRHPPKGETPSEVAWLAGWEARAPAPQAQEETRGAPAPAVRLLGTGIHHPTCPYASREAANANAFLDCNCDESYVPPPQAPAPGGMCPHCLHNMELVARTAERIKYLEEVERKFYAHVCPQPPAPASPAAPWAEYTKAPVPDLNHVYWLVWAARHMVAVCAGRDADIATVSDQAKLLGVLLAKHFANIPDVVGSKAITPAEPEAGSPAAGESQGAKLPNLEQLSPAEHRDLLRRAGTQGAKCRCGHPRTAHDMGRDGDCLKCGCVSYKAAPRAHGEKEGGGT